jgi:hypothetical protein
MTALFFRRMATVSVVMGLVAGVTVASVARAADAVCVAMIQPAVETATGTCSTFPTPCEVPKGWAPVDRCFQDAYPQDRDGIWSVMPGQTDSQGNPLKFSLLDLRVSMPTNSGAVLFLHEGSWEGYVGPFDPVMGLLRITTLNQQVYNVWSVAIYTDSSASITGEVCRDGSDPATAYGGTTGDGSTTPSVTAKSRCLIPEGSQISLEKLL